MKASAALGSGASIDIAVHSGDSGFAPVQAWIERAAFFGAKALVEYLFDVISRDANSIIDKLNLYKLVAFFFSLARTNCYRAILVVCALY